MEQRHDNAVCRWSLALGIVAGGNAYWSGQLDEISWAIEASFANISVCRSDSLTSLASSSRDTTKYSTSRHSQHTNALAEPTSKYLVAPEQLISAPVPDPIPCMQELGDSMESDVVCELLCVFPGERSTEG